jgi:hypothetical protein
MKKVRAKRVSDLRRLSMDPIARITVGNSKIEATVKKEVICIF